ncbi:histidine kinase [Pontibacter sp. G13]|uniref:sensor histidine kinase n=1 Tax=Pontibacter sp. G13 TaxID=3074898 RepID=UPI002889B1AE|nr:histidine kinase [Pontibacter sp. G13]WNJ17088.1 histidine kinase [Pontibacter sp. G13]
MEGTFSVKDLSVIFLVVIACMFFMALGVILIFRIAQKRLMEEQEARLQEHLNHQRKLLITATAVQERERKQIAQEIHDDLGFQLTSLSMFMSRLKRVENPEDLQAFFQEGMTAIRNISDRARALSHKLVPPTLEYFGLDETLREIVSKLRRETELDIRYHFEGSETHLPDHQHRLHIVRIFQELIQNSIKYSGAEILELMVEIAPDRLKLMYRDHGVGFDAREDQRGLGLKNLDARAQMLGAQLEFHSAKGEGVRANIDTPLPISLSQPSETPTLSPLTN